MNKSLKALFMASMLPVMMLMAAVTLTSCEGTLDDIFGEWSRPTGQQNNEPTKEEVLDNLSSALEEGALVTITYTVDGVTYTSTFKKVGDEYVEQSTTSASRALTRASTSIQALIYYLGADNSYNFRAIEDEKIVLNTQIDVATATTTTTFSSNGAAFGGMTVNGKPVLARSGSTKWINVILKISGTNMGAVGCKEGDTWDTFYQRLSKNGHMIIQISDGVVSYSNGFVSGQLYKDADCTDPVSPDDQITQDVYLKVEPITYQEARWNGSYVDYVSRSTDEFTLVSSSDGDVTWSGGTYVVRSNVTIGDDRKTNGNITLRGDVNLILCDGARLIVSGKITGNKQFSLTIYGQSQGDTAGKLEVKDGLGDFSYLTIHGGNITVESGDYGINNSPLTVYGGIVSITSIMYAIYTGHDNNMNVYGGEVNAISLYHIGIDLDYGSATLTVYGGKATAQGGGGNPAIDGYFKAGQESTIKYKVGVDQAEGILWSDESEMQITPRQLSNEYRYFKAWPSSN